MKDHFDLSDTEFIAQIEKCELDPSQLSHVAHLRFAWIHIDRYGRERAMGIIQQQLESFVAHANAADKYHKTLTVAAILIVDHFMTRSSSSTFMEFITEFPQLKNNFKGLIGAHYSFDIFASDHAKIEYVEPDLIPFEKED